MSRYKALVDSFAADIRNGELAPGTRLPTHRRLAADHGIAVVTATRVYAELEAIGLVSREQGRGTFVRDLALPAGLGVDQEVVAADAVDLNFNYPSLPGQTDLLRRALRDLATSGDLEALLRYQPHRGRPADRAAVAHHLRRRGLEVDPARVLIVSGAQHGLAVVGLGALKPGDLVAVDPLTYPGFKALAQSLSLELVPVAGLDALARLCARRPVRAVYTMPTLHNPLGTVMPLSSRAALADLAHRHDLLLIEDGSYAYLEPDPPAPLAALAPEHTVYVSGLSKSVATGLRVGFVVAPPVLGPALERAIRLTTWNTPALSTVIACRWLEDGTVDDLEVRKRADAAARQDVARSELAGLTLVGHPSSYFTWLPLPDDARADRLAVTLGRARISVTTAEPFSVASPAPRALRLALGSTDLESLRVSLRTVRRVVLEDAFQ
nr:PLP-dependent aminotransferase family protein [Cryptosporangium arvum]